MLPHPDEWHNEKFEDKNARDGVTDQMLRLHDILASVKAYNSNSDFDLIQKAYVYAAKHHAGQRRKSGDPYLSHPLEVAKILADMKLDEASICTGLLHDTVEDTEATSEEIEALFGRDIAHLVDGVTKLSQIKFFSQEEKQALRGENQFQKGQLAAQKEEREQIKDQARRKIAAGSPQEAKSEIPSENQSAPRRGPKTGA